MTKSKKNFIYQSMYQMLLIVLPFITAPYMSRVLGANGIGIYSYSVSVVSYFTLFAKLGIDTYANREVAKLRDDKQKLSCFFWNMFSLHAIVSFLVLVVYLAYVFWFTGENQYIFIIQIFTLLSFMLDITWLFFGLEEFKITIIRNVVIKIATVVLIFIFVNKREDLWIYTLIMCVSTFLSQIYLWRYLKKYVEYVKPTFGEMIIHLSPMLVLFIPSIAMSIYRQMDKVMLGIMTTYDQVGIYEYAEKLINAPVGLISALGIVMLPKMANLYEKKQTDQAVRFIDNSMTFIMFLSLACAAGLIGISRDFVPMFFGEEFNPCIMTTIILSVEIPIVAWSNVIRTQYLLPKGKDKIFVISMCSGALINLVINYLLIPGYGADGAAIGTLITQICICIIQTSSAAKDLNIKKYVFSNIRFLISAAIMLALVKLVSKYMPGSIFAVIAVEFSVGVLFYALMNIKYILKLIKNR